MFSAQNRQKNKNIQPGPEKQHSYKTKNTASRLQPSELPFAERVLVQNVSHQNHENDLIFMRMTAQVTSYFHTNSFAQRLVLPQGQK